MPDINETRHLGSSTVPSLEINLEQLGPPGSRVTLHIFPQFEGETLSDGQKLSDARPRTFRVSAKLSNSQTAIGRIVGDFKADDGDSYLMITPPRDHFRVDTEFGQFQIRKNAAGRLSYIEMDCVAANFIEARSRFIQATYPALDHFSYIMDVSLTVAILRILDLTHNTIHIDLL